MRNNTFQFIDFRLLCDHDHVRFVRKLIAIIVICCLIEVHMVQNHSQSLNKNNFRELFFINFTIYFAIIRKADNFHKSLVILFLCITDYCT